MSAIENYYNKPSLEAAILTAYLSGDLDAVNDGLTRLNRTELTILVDSAEALGDMAAAKVDG